MIGIVMPVHARVPQLIDATFRAVATFRTAEPAFLCTVVNQQTVLPMADFAEQLYDRWHPYPGNIGNFRVLAEGERCVAGAWNRGIAYAREVHPATAFFLVVNNDVELEPETINTLVAYGRTRPPTVALWSASNTRDAGPPPAGPTATHEGCDFSCFMVAANFVTRFGRFDENFVPAYYEDNDIYARVVLGGGTGRVVEAARYHHAGSQTIRQDPAASGRNGVTFPRNHAYFTKKWGTPSPGRNDAEIQATYYPSPFNDPSNLLTWWPVVSPERAGDFY